MSFKIKSFPPYMEVWILVDDQDPKREYAGLENTKMHLYNDSYYLSKHDAELDMCIGILEGKNIRMHRLLWPVQPGWPEE